MKKQLTGLFSLVLALAVFCTFQFAFVQEASAASGSKTVYLITQAKTTSVDDSGTHKSVSKSTYNKNGLMIQGTYSSKDTSVKTVYKRNKAGAVTEVRHYSKDKLMQVDKYTVKSGKTRTIKSYSVDPKSGKKSLDATTKYTYKKGKLSKTVRTDTDGNKTTMTYYTNGNAKRYEYKGEEDYSYTNYNKKGAITTYGYSYGTGEYKTVTKGKNKSTFDKKGNIKKEVETVKMTYNGTTTETVNTTTYQYQYKSGRIYKEIVKFKSVGVDTVYKSTDTTTYTYKKFKVAKKYQKYL